MSHPLSLSFLTTYDTSPLDAIGIAGTAGYDLVGLRLVPAAASGELPYPIMSDKALQREVRAALQDSPVQLADVEIVRLGEKSRSSEFRAFCELAEYLGARHVLVAGDDSDLARLSDTFAGFCELAASHHLTADLEFMPWTGVKNLADAVRVVNTESCSNAGILVDALHFDRSDTTLEEVRALPAERIHYAQLCDASREYDPSEAGLIEIARAARKVPGAGDIDVDGLVLALPDETILSIEVPNHEAAKSQTPLQRARHALQATREVLQSAGRA